MSDTIIKNCRMDWGTEVHKFTFRTGGCPRSALESLSDLMSSLLYLYEKIEDGEYGDIYQEGIPMEIKVVGKRGQSPQIEQ